jgi:hypothetical protein
MKMMSHALSAPSRFIKDDGTREAEWISFENCLHSRLLQIFSDNAVSLPVGLPAGEENWRDLAIQLALKSGELAIELDGEPIPSGSISIEMLDRRLAVRTCSGYRPALGRDQIKDEVFKFFYTTLDRERSGLLVKSIRPAFLVRYNRVRTLLEKRHGFGLSTHHLMLKFPQQTELYRLKAARRLLGLPDDYTTLGNKVVNKREAARLAAAELHLWLNEPRPSRSEVLKIAEGIRTNLTRAIGPEDDDTLHPRYLTLLRIQRVYSAIRHAGRRVCVPVRLTV